MSINWQELHVIHLGLFHFQESRQGKLVGLFSSNTTALAYLKKQGKPISQPLNTKAQLLLRWTEFMGITFLPQFIMGARNVVADSLNHRYQFWGQNGP